MAQNKDIVVDIEGRHLKLSNLDKVLYPEAGFTKGQVIDYFVRIAPVLLPHLHGRPLTMKRYPNGVNAQYFYEKNCPEHRPEWVQVAPVWSSGNNKWINYCMAQDLPTLVWAANLADLELHTSLSLSKDVMRPSFLVFDLDPGAPANIVQCCQVGLWVRDIFDRLGLKCFAKTSGSKGMQIYVPLNTAGHLRADEAVCPRDSAAAGAATSRTGRLRHEESAAHRQGPGGLEPERRPQDDDLCVLAAGQGAADGVDSGEVGRGGELPEEGRCRRCWCLSRTRCWSE